MDGAGSSDDADGLALWQAAIRSAVPGAATAALLEQRPEFPATDDRWEIRRQADAVLDSVIARQAMASHQAARLQVELDWLSRHYPGPREHLAGEVALALGVAEATADKYLDDAASIRRLPATFAALDAGRITAFKATVIRIHTEHVSEQVARAVEQRVVPAAGQQTMPELREACTSAVLRIDPAGAEDRHEKAVAGRGMSRRHLAEGMALLFIESAAQDIAVVFEACTALGLAARVKGDKRTADQRRMDALTDVCRDILDTGRWTPAEPVPVPPSGGTGTHGAENHGAENHSAENHSAENHSAGKCGATEPGAETGTGGTSPKPRAGAGPIVTDPEPATAATPERNAGAAEAADATAAADDTMPANPVDASGPAGPLGPRPSVVLPDRGSRRPHIMVTVPAATLNGGNQPGYLAGHGPITAGQARTIAADGDLTRLICDPTTGALLDYGRTRYRPPDMLRDFVHTRDRTCVTPGCRAPAARTDIDHVTPYKPGQSVGGPTDVDNLASLCRHHHRGKDGGGSRLRHHPRTGHWTWTTALGRTYTRPVVSLWEPADPGEERALRNTKPPTPNESRSTVRSAPPPDDDAAPPSTPDKTPPPF